MNHNNEQDMNQGVSGIVNQNLPVASHSTLNPPNFQKQSNSMFSTGYPNLQSSSQYLSNSSLSGQNPIPSLRTSNLPLVNNHNQYSYSQQSSISSGFVEPISIPSSTSHTTPNKIQYPQNQQQQQQTSQQLHQNQNQQTNFEDDHQALPPLSNYYNSYYPYSNDLPPLTSYSTSSSLPSLSGSTNFQQISPTTNYPYQNPVKPTLQSNNSFNSYLQGTTNGLNSNSNYSQTSSQLSPYNQTFANQYTNGPNEVQSFPPRKPRKNSATVHNMTPETAARNRCTICQKQFKRPSSLQTHMYSHTGEKLFKCPWPECSKVFSVKSNMTRHYKLHLKDKRLSI